MVATTEFLHGNFGGGGNAVGRRSVRFVLKHYLHSSLNKIKKYLFSMENYWERLLLELTPFTPVGHTEISKQLKESSIY